MSETIESAWKAYVSDTLHEITPLITELGFVLDEEQIHTGGERYLMKSVTTTSGRKLILLGSRMRDNKRVVIKISSDTSGAKEIEHERICRKVLKDIQFAYHVFFAPEELAFKKAGDFTIVVTAFIEQEKTFLEHSLEEQFFLALKAFEAQEGAHATTYEHRGAVKSTFDIRTTKDYLDTFDTFAKELQEHHKENTTLLERITRGASVLKENKEIIELYEGFLTHNDFVPHNIRIVNKEIFLLDHSSMRFGNKYEGWARFLNFMALYNPELEQALITYVQENRGGKEYTALHLMRIYRLGEILWYYTNKLPKSSGDLLKLNNERILFWSDVLQAVLDKTPLSQERITAYTEIRDKLRSDEEKKRQHRLH